MKIDWKSKQKKVVAILFIGVFTVFATVLQAKSSNMFCSQKQGIVIVLKNYADLDTAKDLISNMQGVKIVKIQDREKEWSKMVNKMDLPKMENPFMNEFTIKTNKKADTNEILNNIKDMDFVEEIKYIPILSDIDCYQENYFAIIKRNNVLLQTENDKTLNEDRKDLDKLFKIVKKQITNKYYLKKYNDIKKHYAKCDEITDIGMKEFADKNYKEVDNFLNEVYKEVKSKISPEDFKKLAKNEDEWLKEVEDYYKVFSSMNYGTLGTLIYYDYQINMKEFRTLLLMLYL